MRRLIVSADDFGLCPGTVDGILHGYLHGIVTSTSVILTVPAAMSAVEAAYHNRGLDVGVHLTFTEGYPVMAAEWVPSLLNEWGRFLTAQEWLEGGRRPKVNELAVELRAQMALPRQGGIRPSHIDLHAATGYLMPEVFELTVSLAAEWGLAVRFPFGEGWEDIAASMARAAGIAVSDMDALVRRYRQVVTTAEIAHPDRFIEALPPGHTSAEELIERIHNLGEGTTEFLTHPAFAAGSRMYLGEEQAAQRAAELAVLCDARVRQAIDEEGIELVSFQQL
jgi:predicted glycoside hydrolase/deacetylase ChbG (UPF0249 family)